MTTTALSPNGSGTRTTVLQPPPDCAAQAFALRRTHPLGLSPAACDASIAALNQLLADIMVLRDMYKKHHWQASGPTFYALHLLFDRHFEEQLALVDQVAERVQLLGGSAVAMAQDVAEATLIPRVPKGREAPTTQMARLLHAHEIVLQESRTAARQAATHGDDGTSDLIVSDVIRTNEVQVWFLVMHTACDYDSAQPSSSGLGGS